MLFVEGEFDSEITENWHCYAAAVEVSILWFVLYTYCNIFTRWLCATNISRKKMGDDFSCVL